MFSFLNSIYPIWFYILCILYKRSLWASTTLSFLSKNHVKYIIYGVKYGIYIYNIYIFNTLYFAMLTRQHFAARFVSIDVSIFYWFYNLKKAKFKSKSIWFWLLNSIYPIWFYRIYYIISFERTERTERKI